MTDLASWARKVTHARASLLAAVALLAVGGIAGYLADHAAARDSHAAKAVMLTGRVIVTNTDSRWIVFYPDGVDHPDNDVDYIWHVIADRWQDASGGLHQDDTYPPCLAGDGAVEANPRRVELTSIDWDNGTRQPLHVALRVHCLD